MKAYGYKKGEQFLLDLWPIGGGFYLEELAAYDFMRMADAAEKDGITLRINTAYRSWKHQRRLYKDFEKKMLEWNNGGRLGKRPSVVAEPGFSTHQSGRSVDLNRAHDDTNDNGIADGTTDQWLQTNAIRFNFVNDVKSEPWHWTNQASEQNKCVA